MYGAIDTSLLLDIISLIVNFYDKMTAINLLLRFSTTLMSSYIFSLFSLTTLNQYCLASVTVDDHPIK